MSDRDEAAATDLRVIAHDLANLLTVLHGSLELAERHADGNPVLARLIANMRQAADRADGIIGQLRAREPGA